MPIPTKPSAGATKANIMAYLDAKGKAALSTAETASYEAAEMVVLASDAPVDPASLASGWLTNPSPDP